MMGTIYGLIYQQSQRSCDDPVILSHGRAPLQYGDLLAHIERIVGWLRNHGIGSVSRLALVLPNGSEMAVAFLSVAAGCVCAPLNPAYNQEEFTFYLSDLGVTALICQEGIDTPARQASQALGIPIFELVPETEAPAGIFSMAGPYCDDASHDGFPGPDDLGLILHTSGTTARPKIVPLSQANLSASAQNVADTLALTPADRCLNVMPLFHIHGLVAGLLASLAKGSSVLCTTVFDADRFFTWLEEFQPTWYTAVPTIHQAILSGFRLRQEHILPLFNVSGLLRLVRSSSAPLPPTVMADLEQVFNAPVIEAYGMTEAAHQMASNPLPPRKRKPGSVGIPAGPEITILDQVGNFLPVGHKGEIVIRGANVMAGYENNPQANQAAFSNGWFRTGDEGYFDEDGYLFISGRIKEIINRGGEKVTPREVDEVFLEHPAVAQAVTFAVPHPTLGEDVAVAVVLRNNQSITPQALRQAAFTRLADFKVPSQVLIVSSIPKGATGKIQRIGLAEKLAAYLKPALVSPRNDIEEVVVGFWGQVLRAGPYGIHDNFFANGGDSILAMQLNARLQSAFGLDLPQNAVFLYPTVEEQALFIEACLLDDIENPKGV
jgi:acyl-CoA synthetase (AMP-forming)/AMP-acid ligase II